MGKVSTALQLLLHPSEVGPLITMYREAKRVKSLPRETKEQAFCYEVLNRVSRSFAIVIQQLPEELRDPVCIFYLVLRALDTVEDDMRLPNERKVPLLESFHDRLTDQCAHFHKAPPHMLHFMLMSTIMPFFEEFFIQDVGDSHCRELLEQYPKVTAVFISLEPGYQRVIADITRRMGAGMAEFIAKDVETIGDYDLYCHYVAGLVGVGLCRLFGESGCEAPKFSSGAMDGLANDMGLFLQKTNIIRDYLEDIMEEPAPRMFWPREIWHRYAEQLSDFKSPQNRAHALKCLNHMVADAVKHAPACLEYMSHLRDREVFAFCAIPQIMAIATLQQCYNNGKVFEGAVKMRRGQTAKVFTDLKDMGSLYQQFCYWSVRLHDAATKLEAAGDPTAGVCAQHLQDCLTACQQGVREHGLPLCKPPKAIAPSIVALCYLIYAMNASYVRELMGMPTTAATKWLDLLQPAAALLMLLFNLVRVIL